MKPFFYLSLLVLLLGCNNSTTLNDAEKEAYLNLGDSISNSSQMVLLSKVGKQIQQNGVVGAVDFCSENAVALTDSLSNKYSYKIKRLTDKSRNPENLIQTEIDKKVWNELKSNPDSNHLIVEENNSMVYYKSIRLGMPTCLMCHGNPQTDIAPETLKLIRQKYLQDQAIGYELGDFRGMWKVELK